LGISHSKSTNPGKLAPKAAQYPLDWKKMKKREKKMKKKEKKEGKKRELPDSRTLQVLLLIFYYLYLLDIENSILVVKVLNYVIGRCIW
jgi:hypothetical protein